MVDPVWKLNKLWTIEYRDDDAIGYILSHYFNDIGYRAFRMFSVFIANRSVRSFRLFSGPCILLLYSLEY